MPNRRIHPHEAQVATSETARGINRSIVLNLIRRRQPISRADLARVSGLQRSTVSLITEQLIREKWVIYGPTGRLPRGRRPTFLQLNDHRAILVLDLRPSLTTIAVSDVNGRFLAQQVVLTPPDPESAASIFAEKMRQMIANHSDLVFEGIGVSVPGRYDHLRKRVVFTPNLKWPEFDLHEPLEKATGLKVEMENAANACVLAEVWFGNVEKVHNMAVVTVAEGVGVGIYSEGRLVRGFKGMAGEFGHVTVDPDGPLCGCGGRGCWEMYASNWAALRYYNESGAGSRGPSFQFLISLAESGDSLAIKALEQMAHAIGRGMRLIVAGLAPEEIVLVGEFTRLWKRLGPLIEADIAASSLIGNPPRVRPAATEPSMARLRGAVGLVLEERFTSSKSKLRQTMDVQRAAASS